MKEYDLYRKCKSCGFRGYMDRWFCKSIYPLLISFLLLLLGLFPGILFIALCRNKLVCPQCGAFKN